MAQFLSVVSSECSMSNVFRCLKYMFSVNVLYRFSVGYDMVSGVLWKSNLCLLSVVQVHVLSFYITGFAQT